MAVAMTSISGEINVICSCSDSGSGNDEMATSMAAALANIHDEVILLLVEWIAATMASLVKKNESEGDTEGDMGGSGNGSCLGWGQWQGQRCDGFGKGNDDGNIVVEVASDTARARAITSTIAMKEITAMVTALIVVFWISYGHEWKR